MFVILVKYTYFCAAFMHTLAVEAYILTTRGSKA